MTHNDDTPAPTKAPAIARAAAILRLLGKSEAPMGVQAIARELGLVPSTCLYVLRALTAEDLVAFNPDTKRYALDAGVLTLARGWLKRDAFSDLAQGALDRLARDYGVTMLGVQINGLDHMIVTALAQGGGNFQLSAEIGSRFPALISATGRCLAAFGGYSPEVLKSRFHALRWDVPPSFDQWLAEVEQTRANGFGVDDGHYMAGITVIAAPLWAKADRATPTHALVALGIGGAVQRAGVEAIGADLIAQARTLSSQMSGR